MNIFSNNPKSPNELVLDMLLVVFGMILCAIPLAVVSVRYVQALPTNPTTTASTSVITSSTSTLPIPSQCTTYIVNNDSTRNVGAGPGAICDNGLTVEWYRFMGGAGNYLATSYVYYLTPIPGTQCNSRYCTTA